MHIVVGNPVVREPMCVKCRYRKTRKTGALEAQFTGCKADRKIKSYEVAKRRCPLITVGV